MQGFIDLDHILSILFIHVQFDPIYPVSPCLIKVDCIHKIDRPEIPIYRCFKHHSTGLMDTSIMKTLLNTALITALSFSIGACTIVTDPSSGSSASSGGSSSAGFMNRQQQMTEFAKANLERLKQDMAAGQGEYLASLATLLDIEPQRQPEFFALTQSRFTALFPHQQTTATEMLAALDRELRADPRFGQRLALK